MIRIRLLGKRDYVETWDAMRRFTDGRNPDTPDEIWFLEHPPVYTLGVRGAGQDLLRLGNIPVVASDRGGLMTYHGPGQLIVYPLLDLRRSGLNVRQVVHALEQSVIDLLGQYAIRARRLEGAPGVYVEGRKIASLGLRVRGGCSYHGLSFNVRMDLSPFAGINPCGMAGLEVTQLSDFSVNARLHEVVPPLLAALLAGLGYAKAEYAAPDELIFEKAGAGWAPPTAKASNRAETVGGAHPAPVEYRA
jgi:lipoyl(octanoyl) transferase